MLVADMLRSALTIPGPLEALSPGGSATGEFSLPVCQQNVKTKQTNPRLCDPAEPVFLSGVNPYPGIPVDANFYKMIRSGFKMDQPFYATEDM